MKEMTLYLTNTTIHLRIFFITYSVPFLIIHLDNEVGPQIRVLHPGWNGKFPGGFYGQIHATVKHFEADRRNGKEMKKLNIHFVTKEI